VRASRSSGRRRLLRRRSQEKTEGITGPSSVFSSLQCRAGILDGVTAGADDDATLLARYRRGDARAMDRLVDRHGPSVYAFVRRMLGDSPVVDDLVQDVWVKVLRSPDSFDGRARLTTWLFAVARNACLDHLRRDQRRRGVPDPVSDSDDGAPGGAAARAVDPGPPVLDAVAKRELGQLVERAVAELPPAQREVFLLREGTDLSFTEIGESLGLPKDTVKSRMRYAVEHVRRFLRDRFGVRVGAGEERAP
jgi:RNA polymerase sigma-70 factor (ECF subfamily)